jgi:CRP-like cAMP-binding protein
MDAAEFRQVFPGLVRDLSEDESSSLLAALTPRTHAKGARLSTFGERADTLHLVTRGQLAIRATASGETLLLGQAGRGGVVGEVGLIEPGPASATVEALEPTSTLDLDPAGLERLCDEQPAAASALLLALSGELAHRVRRSSTDILRKIDDHAWMRSEAKRDRKGWLARMAQLVLGSQGDES